VKPIPSVILRLFVTLALGAVAPAQEAAKVLREGHWVQVKGTMDANGRFVAQEIELLEPDDKEVVIGVVTRIVSREEVEMLNLRVRLSGKTEWRDTGLGDLEGRLTRVQGRYRGSRTLEARQVAVRDKGRESIEGRIDQIMLDGSYLRLTMLGLDVQPARDVELDHERPVEEYALAPERAVQAINRNQNRNDDDEIAGRLRIGDSLTIGGQFEIDLDRRDNYDLDDTRARDRSDYELSLRVQAVWQPTDDIFSLVSVRHLEDWRDDEDAPTLHQSNTQLSEGYLYWRGPLGLGFDLQVGRQDFDDKREWLYDQNLDAVRLIRSSPAYRLELSAATTLSDGSRRDQDSRDLIAYLSNNSLKRHLAVYVIDREDQVLSGERFTHIGGRLYGDWLPQQQVWLEAAGLLGETGGEDVGALGFDLGTTWYPKADWAPALTVGWAWGSGDKEPASGNNGTFRQTGFQDNNDSWSGVTAFRYYGELVEPELANLSIATLGVGKRITRNNSIDLVWHRYDQVEPAAALINTNLRSTPNGVDTYIGWELDLIFGTRTIPYTPIEIVLGYFDPGDAFPDGDSAWLARFQLRYRF